MMIHLKRKELYSKLNEEEDTALHFSDISSSGAAAVSLSPYESIG